MSYKYSVKFWVNESVWVRRTFEIETETQKTEAEIKQMIDDKSIYQHVADVNIGDYFWESAKTIGLDSEDMEVEKLH